jgi:hypothetical protein
MKTPRKPTIQQLRKKYTRTIEHEGEWLTYLEIGHQSFLIAESHLESRAKWFEKMMATALKRLLENESSHPQTRSNP